MEEKAKKHFTTVLIATIIIMLMALILHLEGRLPICSCGFIRIWHGQIISSEDSQHLFDWYSFTHFLHGLVIYFALWLIDRKKKLGTASRLLIAVGVAAGWEILENSSFIINRYRTETISLNYYGDSIINSVGDVISMAVGFMFAYKMRWYYSLIAFFIIETLLALVIHDNLTINIIMLIHPISALKEWQNHL